MVGAGTRWAVVTSIDAASFPWPVLGLNIAGSVLLGALLAEEWEHVAARLLLHDAGGIGFCGGLTTFSTFSLEVVDLVREGDTVRALAYAVASVVGAMVGIVVGAGALRHVRGIALPLEERP